MSKELPYFDSIKSASAVLGVPTALLRQAKAAGCPAFRGSRVYRKEWQEWVAKTPVVPQSDAVLDTKEGWEIERLRKTCRKLDLEYEVAQGDLISKAEVKVIVQSAIAPICSTLERHLDKTAYNALCKDVRQALEKIAK
jgi:hypothetical protein